MNNHDKMYCHRKF